ncbi:MAG: bifunctional alpha,alpha-trehalose-phosphate synthase (UDP-forming)/trehalose-phosphatase [Desulfitobacteriaceae bacterium]|nr:bifunctional alpha,alpha-trehalose-phosphate synthase (UDP-forming)/trehalose-phosphatase [Desulfitobacteriaceae bacterium]MDI6913555.1 bifunctional alpha,alpha-trehalose-phosphate synthase (UDP-forming)/trehalose-phosphatase [Desulfitobacteriaceae bacterium]
MRLLVVSNRLPIHVTVEQGQFGFTQSTGGLVSGLSSYLDSLKGSASGDVEYIWVGWPGLTVLHTLQEQVKSRMQREFRAHPVFLAEEAMDKFYHGFCNKILWPLFHYFPSYAVYDQEYWLQYKEVNELFLDAVLDIVEPGDVIWVHDYHLMLLPRLLSEKLPKTPIGFFLHIPFPSYEIFRLLPTAWGKELLEGLLGAKLVGFHTEDYTQHFLDCVRIQLGLDAEKGKIRRMGHPVQAATFPMGIDFAKFNDPNSLPEVQRYQDSLKPILGGVKTVLSIDRLDYSKGITNRLRGYALFLEENPEWRERLVLLLIVVPSRIGVEHYQQLKKQIDEIVGQINGRFGSVSWTPIIYQYKFLPFEPLLAMYRSSDVALITPLRDGMNLIAKEYIAARTDRTGVLILSQLAGAAKEASEALIINPNSLEEIAGALKQALLMPREEQIRRNTIMQEQFRTENVVKWSGDFLGRLSPEVAENEGPSASVSATRSEQRPVGLSAGAEAVLCQDYTQAQRRLFLLDYDGTLIPFATEPGLAVPSLEVLKTLAALASDSSSEVVLLSGRDRTTLNTWFGRLGISLVAEHGIWLKEQGVASWQLTSNYPEGWQKEIRALLLNMSQNPPGSFVEEKEYTLAWHYRRVDPSKAEVLLKGIQTALQPLLDKWQLQLLPGNKVLEIRPRSMDKGKAARRWLQSADPDFILAMGDDTTDEDMFEVLPPWAYSLKVGREPSLARFQVDGPTEVLGLLGRLGKERVTAVQKVT